MLFPVNQAMLAESRFQMQQTSNCGRLTGQSRVPVQYFGLFTSPVPLIRVEQPAGLAPHGAQPLALEAVTVGPLLAAGWSLQDHAAGSVERMSRSSCLNETIHGYTTVQLTLWLPIQLMVMVQVVAQSTIGLLWSFKQ